MDESAAPAVDAIPRGPTRDLARAIIEHMAEGVALVGASDGTILYVNRAWAEMFGYGAETVVGTPIWTVNAGDVEGGKGAIEAELDERGRWCGDILNRRADGSTFWSRVKITAFDHTSLGRVWISVHEDVSDRRRAMETLEHTLAMERQVAERLREAARQQEHLLQVVSHDLRGPLTTIVGFAQTLESLWDKLPMPERNRFLERIIANAERLAELVTRLLDEPPLVEGRSPAKQHPTDVAALVRRLVEAMDLTSHPVRVDANRLLLCVDPTQFERIVENLVANAARHTPPGTDITVTVKKDGDHAAVVVEDQGPGIPPELIPNLFEPYRKGSASPGMGLGLALVLGLVEMHGGTVSAANTETGGAAFTVRIPRRRAAELVEDREDEAAAG